MYKAVIFDLDGTLLDTIDDIADAVNAALRVEGFPPHDVETYKVMIGAGIENLIWQALPEGCRDEVSIQRCLVGIREQYRKHGLIKTRVFEGIPELLDELVARDIKLAVLSNKPHESTTLQVTHYLSRWSFEAVEGAKPEDPVKPDPATALRIARGMGVEPGECIFMGDSDVDMRTAKNAGMHPVGAVWGFRSTEELKQNGAEALIEEPLELMDVLTLLS